MKNATFSLCSSKSYYLTSPYLAFCINLELIYYQNIIILNEFKSLIALSKKIIINNKTTNINKKFEREA